MKKLLIQCTTSIPVLHQLTFPKLPAFILKAHVHQRLSIFTLKNLHLNVQSKAFSCIGVKIWNGIPTSLKTASKNSLKKSIRTKLIEILETENSYVDIDTLINKMNQP